MGTGLLRISSSPDCFARWRCINRTMTKDTQQRILDCAITLFGRLGVANVNLGMVAAEANLTRQAIYRYHRDRDSLFVEAARNLHAAAFEAAEKAALRAVKMNRSLALTLSEVLDARFTPFLERLEPEHVDEMLATSARLVGDVAADYNERLTTLVVRLIKLHRSSTGATILHDLDDQSLARYLIYAVRGVKNAASSKKILTFRREMHLMVEIVIRGGLTGGDPHD